MPMITDDGILKNIKSPLDLRNLNKTELEELSVEIRDFLIRHVSENGGHLASNLGTVELTLALARVFDFSNDRIVWDVGHQSYTYKLLTGRYEAFDSIRKRDGISGFPKREESIYDHFNTGHSSTSISAALGFARAARLTGRKYHSIAVIGDGALTGGLALEAMNDAGASGDNVIILLNDNEMSISKNVGGIAEYFSRLRSIRLYSGTNEKVRSRVEKIPLIGKLMARSIHNLKSAVKYLFSQGMLFEEMGLTYLGPVNGHDIKKLESILNDALKVKGPVLVHAMTTKGRGLTEAENEPEKYHGVKGNGHADACEGNEETYSSMLGSILTDMAPDVPEMTVICPAVAPGCGLSGFASSYGDRFFDVGIAEQHAVTLAAGMACSGLIPVVCSYSTFMQRANDQIIHDVCLMKLHVVFAMDRAGIVSEDGETHQGIYDLAYLSHMPGIKVFTPYNGHSMKQLFERAVGREMGPVVIRYPKGCASTGFYDNSDEADGIRIYKGGNKVLVVSYGRMLSRVYKMLIVTNELKDCSLAGIEELVPLDTASIIDMAGHYEKVIFIEDVVYEGSCAQRFISKLKGSELNKYSSITVPAEFNATGSIDEILDGIGMGNNGIIMRLNELLIG